MKNPLPLETSQTSIKYRLFFVLIFFLITPIALGTTLLTLLFSSNLNNKIADKENYPSVLKLPRSGVQVYASLPIELPSISAEIVGVDARVEIVRQYLDKYNSPLTPYADEIVKSADKYGVDYRLTTAIAQKESNLCKIIPPESYNCWGWGIHSKGTLGFGSYTEGIETVTRGLKNNYIDKGYTTIEDIMSKYTPLSKGSWAKGVLTFMGQMQ